MIGSWMEGGGFIMYPLLICSIIVWAVAIEKIWFLYSFSKRFEEIHEQIIDLISTRKVHEAKGLCRSAHYLLTGPYLAIFEYQGHSDDIWEQKVGRRFSESTLGMKRFLWMLGTIGASAPFIGLFGTVVGII